MGHKRTLPEGYHAIEALDPIAPRGPRRRPVRGAGPSAARRPLLRSPTRSAGCARRWTRSRSPGGRTPRASPCAGSAAVIDAAAVVAEAPVASLMELVQARVPGLRLPGARRAGRGGADRIRGVHSVLGDGSVAVYVDGVPVDAEAVSLLDTGNLFRAGIAGIAPEDIESVEVLKGPASTLWLGPAATGGAILVTTRKANPGARGFTQRIVLEHGPVDPGVELPANWAHCGDPYHSTLPICEGQPADMILSDRPSNAGSGWRYRLDHPLERPRLDEPLGRARLARLDPRRWRAPTTGFDRRSARIRLHCGRPRRWASKLGSGDRRRAGRPNSGDREPTACPPQHSPLAVGAWTTTAHSNVTGCSTSTRRSRRGDISREFGWSTERHG